MLTLLAARGGGAAPAVPELLPMNLRATRADWQLADQSIQPPATSRFIPVT